MVFACQKDSYLKEFITSVISCTSTNVDVIKEGKNKKTNGYHIVLEDTILFPEGGGQPDDRGTINEIPVLKVTRKGSEAFHFVETPLEKGDTAHLIVDWQRRFDHMQQHTGQHLITAIAEDRFNFHTTSWNLGEEVSYIEMDTSAITPEEMEKLEHILNEKIRECIPVIVNLYEKESEELKQVRTRLELPSDHSGLIRVVNIDGIDSNTCCGTHVKNLAHLQAIKLLYVEKGKKNKVNLYFVCGGRLLRYMSKCVARERALGNLLTCGPEAQVQNVEKLQKSMKLANKHVLGTLRDLAVLEAKQFKQIEPRPLYFSLHRKDASIEFMTIFANEVKDENVVLFLTVGEDKGSGQMLLTGKQDIIKELGSQICSILGGKGAAKNGKFQAKLSNLGNRSQAEELLKNTVCNNKS